jgi:hypothetical protein
MKSRHRAHFQSSINDLLGIIMQKSCKLTMELTNIFRITDNSHLILLVSVFYIVRDSGTIQSCEDTQFHQLNTNLVIATI